LEGQGRKEGSEKERKKEREKNIPTSPRQKPNPKNKSPLCLSTITFWWMIIKWDSTEPRNSF
jgi:hypothetical protein